MIIDLHAHVKADPELRERAVQALLADMDKHKITKRVISALEGRSIREQNDYVSALVNEYPERLIGCVVINPKEYDAVEEARRALDLPGMRMLEFNSFEHGYYPDNCERIEPVLELAEKKKIPVKVFTGIGARSLPQQWLVHVKKHPNLSFIFLHMGCFDYGYGCIDLALEYDNIYVETSNQYEVQILKKALTRLPKEKIVFGSLYPERLSVSALRIFDLFNPEEAFIKAVYYENAKKLLDI